MKMTLEEMKLAVCEKLPELIEVYRNPQFPTVPTVLWKDRHSLGYKPSINWPTEGLQVCHEAEKLCDKWDEYDSWLCEICRRDYGEACHHVHFKCATYSQRLEALCRVWWPERFK